MALDEKPKKALRGLFQKTEYKAEKEETKKSAPEAAPIKEAAPAVEKVISVKNVPSENQIEKMPTPPAAPTEVIPKIQYNFEYLKHERQNWIKDDYVSFLKRIDNAQTEAFLLKGKLISEVKNRFYENNKQGWIHFCTETLNMNYTTANQYIRVALEFDVTSHQRTDFGFEHFKALLPLPAPRRADILQKIDSNISVKHLRQLVANTIATSGNESIEGASIIRSGAQIGLTRSKHRVKPLIDNLQKVKQELERIELQALSTEEQWSLYGAFKTLSEKMSRLAGHISSPHEHSEIRELPKTSRDESRREL